MPEQYIDKSSLKKIRDSLWAISNKKGITLEDVQDRTGFSYSQVYRIIRGTQNTSISNLLKICSALEIQPKELFDFELEIPKHLPLRKDMKSK